MKTVYKFTKSVKSYGNARITNYVLFGDLGLALNQLRPISRF